MTMIWWCIEWKWWYSIHIPYDDDYAYSTVIVIWCWWCFVDPLYTPWYWYNDDVYECWLALLSDTNREVDIQWIQWCSKSMHSFDSYTLWKACMLWYDDALLYTVVEYKYNAYSSACTVKWVSAYSDWVNSTSTYIYMYSKCASVWTVSSDEQYIQWYVQYCVNIINYSGILML